MNGYILEFGQALLALLLAPGLVGFVRWVKARLQNRRGAPIWLPYFELRKLFGKDVVMSNNASWLFRVAPYIVFASTLAVIFLIPLIAAPLPFDSIGDLLVVVYLLLLGTFFLALAGLDPGTAFGGMGSSREMTVAALAEPTIALAIFGLALGAGSTNLGQIVTATLANPGIAISPGHLLAFAALFIVSLAETGRLPVDNPSTHLELTMIHEAMILEYSARHLALVEWASAIKLMNFSVIGIAVFLPWGIVEAEGWVLIPVALAALFGKLLAGGAALALLETLSAKMRIFRAPEFLGTAFLLAVLGMLTRLLLEQ